MPELMKPRVWPILPGDIPAVGVCAEVEDQRQQIIVAPRPVTKHAYVVKVDGVALPETDCRQTALQLYTGKRRELNDHDTDPEKYRVRMFCDGAEFYADQSSVKPNPDKDRGKSCRQMTGAVRPYYWERRMP